MKQLTGSKLPILKECQFFAREDVEWPEENRSAAASRGLGIHEAIETGDLSGVAFEDLAVVRRGVEYIASLRADGYEVMLEVPMALHLGTGEGRCLRSSGHRDYSDLRPGEVGFTVDYLAFKSNPYPASPLEVGDWKTGYGAHVERASENWQLGVASAALSQMYGDATVTVKLHFLDTGYVDEWTHSAMLAQRFTQLIRDKMSLVSSSKPNPGDHCRYCPAKLGCPAVTGAIQKMLPDLAPAAVQWSLVRVSEENDALMAMHLPALKSAVEAVEKELKARSKQGLMLPNGKVWKPVMQKRTGLDTERMKAFLGDKAAEFVKTTEYETFRQVKP